MQPQYGFVLHDWEDADPLRDLDDFAAQIAALDLVISVDNSTVHMSGGLGVPTWVALPFSADWRWGSTGTESNVYRSVRLFRRGVDDQWTDVFRQIAAELAKTQERTCRGAANEV